jgi:hypothetical protein
MVPQMIPTSAIRERSMRFMGTRVLDYNTNVDGFGSAP